MRAESKRVGVLHAGDSRRPHRLTPPAPMVCIVTAAFGTMIAAWPEAEPRLRGMGIEPAAIGTVAKDAFTWALERCTRESIQSMKSLGVTTLILAYAESNGTFFYLSEIKFYNQDIKRNVKGTNCPFDLYGVVLDEADQLKMRVFLGLGRAGNTKLL